MVVVPATTTTAVDIGGGLLQLLLVVVFGVDTRFEARVSRIGAPGASTIERTRDKVIPGSRNNIASLSGIESQSPFLEGDGGCSNDDEGRIVGDDEDEDCPCWYVASTGAVVRFIEEGPVANRELWAVFDSIAGTSIRLPSLLLLLGRCRLVKEERSSRIDVSFDSDDDGPSRRYSLRSVVDDKFIIIVVLASSSKDEDVDVTLVHSSRRRVLEGC